MKLILLALTCIALALAVTACTETATPTNSSTPRAGSTPPAPAPVASVVQFAKARANYSANCEACHGPTGDGGVVRVNDKQIKVPSLRADHAIKHTDAEMIDFITNGHEAMPAFKDKLKADEITELVSYVRKTYQGK
jgi:mono/diheme cytochrome c family protein